MKRVAMLVTAVIVMVMGAPAARAQNHGEVGAFADYFHLGATGSNFGGLGARASINAWKYVQLEAEMNYDFNQVFTESLTNPTTEAIIVRPTGMRIIHGLFGPKIQTGGGHLRAFVTVKGGFDNFRLDTLPASFDTFASSVETLRTNNVVGAFYPGGGVEAYLGPLGIRAEVGDEIYFASGAHNNWRITFGPTIRF